MRERVCVCVFREQLGSNSRSDSSTSSLLRTKCNETKKRPCSNLLKGCAFVRYPAGMVAVGFATCSVQEKQQSVLVRLDVAFQIVQQILIAKVGDRSVSQAVLLHTSWGIAHPFFGVQALDDWRYGVFGRIGLSWRQQGRSCNTYTIPLELFFFFSFFLKRKGVHTYAHTFIHFSFSRQSGEL